MSTDASTSGTGGGDSALVSVIMPAYNRADMIGDSLDSLLVQTHAPIEIVVVDDGSTDGTADLLAAQSAPVRSVRQEHGGVSRARNNGLAHSSGDLIAFLDSDDLWPPDSLKSRLKVLRADPDIALVYGRTTILRSVEDSRRTDTTEDESVLSPLLGSMLIRRRLFDDIGGFDESLGHSEDVDWVARVRGSGAKIATIDDTTLVYRIHGGNMTFDVAQNQASLLRAVRKSINRRNG